MSTLPFPTQSRLFAALALCILAGPAPQMASTAVVWADLGPEQIVAWEEPANWDAAAYPNGAGVEALVRTPGLSKYVELHDAITLGALRLGGGKTLPGGVLAKEGAVMRFDNGDAPAEIDYTRPSRDVFDVPVEFARDLIVTVHKEWGNSLYFGPHAMFTPLCEDGRASLVFNIRSRAGWDGARIRDRRILNAVESFIEDSLDGAPLAVEKAGPGLLVFASCDNAYSGGTRISDGTLAGINGDGMDPPFLPFGNNAEVSVSTNGSVQLRSSVPGRFGPGDGYALRFEGNASLGIGFVRAWSGAGWTVPPSERRFEIGALRVGGGRLGLAAREGAKLRIAAAGGLSLASNTVVNIWREWDEGSSVPDLDVAGPVTVPSGASVVVQKTGNGRLRLGGDNEFAGFACLTGSVAVAADRALGTGPVSFAPQTELLVEKPSFAPPAKFLMATNSTESWLDPKARFGGAPDAKEGWRMPPGVHLGIGADLRDLSNKVIVMNGGWLHACRNHAGSETNGFVLGPGVAVYTLTNLVVGLPGFPPAGDHRHGERLRSPLRIRGPIREHGGSWSLTKRGVDRVELGGICSLTGGIFVHYGTLALLDTARIGPGTVVVGRRDDTSKTPNGDVWLSVESAEAFAPGTSLEIISGARVNLDFDGELKVSSLVIDGKPCEPGLWAAERRPGIQGSKRFSGKGRLRVGKP